MSSPISLDELRQAIRRFAQERDWEQFHAPKNLAAALIVEAGELLEHFQWLTEEQSRKLPKEKIDQIALEMADVFVYLLRLSDQLNVDLIASAEKKMQINAQKYPVEQARGSARKYSELKRE